MVSTFIDFAAGESSFSAAWRFPIGWVWWVTRTRMSLCHALINAVLGAMSEGDIGMHFPDTDPRYRGIASTTMLDTVLRVMRRRHFKLVNVDVTLVAQQPKLAPYYAAMKKNIARRFGVAENRISIKATTTEKLGWAGQGKGMAATAVVLLRT